MRRRLSAGTAALGLVAGLGAVRLVTSHVSVMVRELSQVFVAGPAVVEAGMGESLDKEQLGGWQVAARAGTVDLVADSEAEALDLVRRVLGYLPANAWLLASYGGLVNAAGRVGTGLYSDRIGRPNAYALNGIVSVVCLLLTPLVMQSANVPLLFLVVASASPLP